MTKWEEFEIECTNYLNRKFSAYATFKHMGGADSTTPDILVRTKHGRQFFIDAKHCPAQCGQFVLLPNTATSTFDYSSENDTQINDYTLLIMNHMNNSFEYYCNAGTAGKDINMSNGEVVFSNWVIEAYRLKGAFYFITNDFTLLPIERFKSFFNIKAKYRIKKSGSSSVGKKRAPSVVKYITNNYTISDTFIDEGHLYAYSPKNLDQQRFILDSKEFMFSLRDKEYEIRKLANTYNANVIFSITRKGNVPGMSDLDFISVLRR